VSLICYLTRVHFADRVLEDALAEEMSRLAIARPLIVTEADAADGDGFDRLLCTLPVSVTPVVHTCDDGTDARTDLARAADLIAQSGCDGIIGFGGMAALDLARQLGDARLPLLTIPTRTDTIGIGPLGSRSRGAPGQPVKLPDAILCDPTLTTGASAEATAAAGMDALVHCLECFLGTAFNPPADGIALDGLRRATLHLEAAVQNGHDLSPRRELLAAALNAGLASCKGFGGIEAASHGLEAITRSRHGALHGALLPEVLTFNSPAVQDRLDAIRTALDLPRPCDPAERLSDLAGRLGLPRRLSDVGLSAAAIPDAARRAAGDPANRTNPRHATARDYEKIMRASL
jgi:4-hydroxybutyrate dehydrogenase